MEIEWSARALADLWRLHDFLATLSPSAAERAIRALATAPFKLQEFPRLGQRVAKYDPREVRRLIVGDYELHYEVQQDTILIVRAWHGREQR